MIEYPPRLKLAHTPTPLQCLTRFDIAEGAPRLWIKRDDLTGSVTSGNKVRKLEFVLAEALRQGADTIITCGGIQSNHCRTTALLCAQLGLHCCLLLRGDEPSEVDGNLLLDSLAGADIRYFSTIDYAKQMRLGLLNRVATDFQEAGKRPFVIPVGASDGIGLWGYLAAVEELKQDFLHHHISPGYIFTATGSGGTQAGLVAGKAIHGLDAQIWGVCVSDDAAYFREKIQQDFVDWQARYQLNVAVDSSDVNLLDGYVAPGYAQATPEVFETIAALARAEGIVLDPVYTGKAFAGLVDQIRQGHFCDTTDIVFIHTGGMFGLFPQRESIVRYTRR